MLRRSYLSEIRTTLSCLFSADDPTPKSADVKNAINAINKEKKARAKKSSEEGGKGSSGEDAGKKQGEEKKGSKEKGKKSAEKKEKTPKAEKKEDSRDDKAPSKASAEKEKAVPQEEKKPELKTAPTPKDDKKDEVEKKSAEKKHDSAEDKEKKPNGKMPKVESKGTPKAAELVGVQDLKSVLSSFVPRKNIYLFHFASDTFQIKGETFQAKFPRRLKRFLFEETLVGLLLKFSNLTDPAQCLKLYKNFICQGEIMK